MRTASSRRSAVYSPMASARRGFVPMGWCASNCATWESLQVWNPSDFGSFTLMSKDGSCLISLRVLAQRMKWRNADAQVCVLDMRLYRSHHAEMAHLGGAADLSD